MSVPAGFGEGGMPVGLQLIGNYFDEGTLLHAAHAFQQATDWHDAQAGGVSEAHEHHRHLIRGYEVVIGIETHAQLSTQSKIFSGSSTAFGAAPNTQASAVDLALPGTLPVLNRGAVERAIRFGLAVGAKIAPLSIFARKNYFYPDLPKGYQISQYETPVVQGGTVEFFVGDAPHTVHLTRAHLEEDAGKSLHEDYQGQTGIDLNRAGTPLLEIVTEPDMRSSAEAVEYAKALHALVVWLGICDGNMQEGSFRCDANVSVRRPGAPFGTRREIKNLNSFSSCSRRSTTRCSGRSTCIEDGGAVQQATVLFDPEQRRDAGDAQQGRRARLPLLPRPRPAAAGDRAATGSSACARRCPSCRARWPRASSATTACRAYDAAMMTQSLAFARYFEAARDGAAAQPKLAANWLMGEVSRRLNAEALEIDAARCAPATLAALIAPHRRRHDLEQRRAPGVRCAVGRRAAATSTR